MNCGGLILEGSGKIMEVKGRMEKGWGGERQAKSSKVEREEGKNIREATTTTEEEEERDANGQQRSAGRTVDQQKRQRNRQTDEPDWTTARDKCWRADGFFFFVIVVFCSMRSLAHDRGRCWMRVAVVSPLPFVSPPPLANI